MGGPGRRLHMDRGAWSIRADRESCILMKVLRQGGSDEGA